jgi:hypothetical protein
LVRVTFPPWAELKTNPVMKLNAREHDRS